jgi:hypothetical protein
LYVNVGVPRKERTTPPPTKKGSMCYPRGYLFLICKIRPEKDIRKKGIVSDFRKDKVGKVKSSKNKISKEKL